MNANVFVSLSVNIDWQKSEQPNRHICDGGRLTVNDHI